MYATPYNNRFNTDSAWPSRPLLGWVEEVGLSAKVVPEPPFVRPFQAGRKGPQLRGLIERYTDGMNSEN
jgi:hypothetical protein